MTSGHELVNPPGLAPPVGFSQLVVPSPGRLVFLGGQTGQLADGSLVGGQLQEQFEQAIKNVVAALRAAGGQPNDLVSMIVYTTRPAEYRANLRALGQIYQHHIGRYYPAMAFFGVTELFDPAAVVELVCTAVLPEARQRREGSTAT